MMLKKFFNLKGNFTQTRGMTFGYVTRPTCKINIMQNRAKMWFKKKKLNPKSFTGFKARREVSREEITQTLGSHKGAF